MSRPPAKLHAAALAFRDALRAERLAAHDARAARYRRELAQARLLAALHPDRLARGKRGR